MGSNAFRRTISSIYDAALLRTQLSSILRKTGARRQVDLIRLLSKSASDSYAHGVGTLTDATSAQTGLATARAAVARAHAQSLINAAALAFATGELTSSTDFATPTPR